MLATAAIQKLSTTPGPAIDFATMPATKYMPVPQHDPTPSDVRSNVVKHFCCQFPVHKSANERINTLAGAADGGEIAARSARQTQLS